MCGVHLFLPSNNVTPSQVKLATLQPQTPKRPSQSQPPHIHSLRLLLPVMPATASSILDLFCVAPEARLLSRLPVAPAPLSLSQVWGGGGVGGVWLWWWW